MKNNKFSLLYLAVSFCRLVFSLLRFIQLDRLLRSIENRCTRSFAASCIARLLPSFFLRSELRSFMNRRRLRHNTSQRTKRMNEEAKRHRSIAYIQKPFQCQTVVVHWHSISEQRFVRRTISFSIRSK